MKKNSHLCKLHHNLLFNLVLCGEMILIELIPKNMGGKITGTKLFIRMLAKGTTCLIIGVLWHVSIEFFWYIQAIFQFICICLIGSIALLESSNRFRL